jgi:hypothetical protein
MLYFSPEVSIIVIGGELFASLGVFFLWEHKQGKEGGHSVRKFLSFDLSSEFRYSRRESFVYH